MKKEYTEPEATIMCLEDTDIICASGCTASSCWAYDPASSVTEPGA